MSGAPRDLAGRCPVTRWCSPGDFRIQIVAFQVFGVFPHTLPFFGRALRAIACRTAGECSAAALTSVRQANDSPGAALRREVTDVRSAKLSFVGRCQEPNFLKARCARRPLTQQVRAENAPNFNDCFRTLHGCQMRFLVPHELQNSQILAGAAPLHQPSRRASAPRSSVQCCVLAVLLCCALCSCVACGCVPCSCVPSAVDVCYLEAGLDCELG
jgi:hypothetical protein